MSQNSKRKPSPFPQDEPLTMPIYKSNKRIFLNDLEKYTSTLLSHLEDLDFSPKPQELSQITDVLSDDLKSETKEHRNSLENPANSPGKQPNNLVFPAINMKKTEDFGNFPHKFYYEAQGYKNYKYKLFAIDLEEIGKCQKLGKKLDADKLIPEKNEENHQKLRSLEAKLREKKKKKQNNLLILSKKYKKLPEKLDTLEEDQEKSSKMQSFPKLNSKFSEVYESKSANIVEKINSFILNPQKPGFSLVKLAKNARSPIIIENYSMENRDEIPVNSDNLLRIQRNYWNISKIIKKIALISNVKEKKHSFDARKEKTILNEFLQFCSKSEDFVEEKTRINAEKYYGTLENFKKLFEIFDKNDPDINNRILLAFGVNPYNASSRIYWEVFLKFKKVVVFQDASLKENVEFLLNYFDPDKRGTLNLSDFRFILKNFCNKIDKFLEEHETLVFEYFLEIFELAGCVSNEKINMDKVKRCLLDLTMNYKYFLMLIVKNFE